ncbi:MAG: helix-turn-helix domain-containing protein, partial [Dongiaceae bacterium]
MGRETNDRTGSKRMAAAATPAPELRPKPRIGRKMPLEAPAAGKSAAGKLSAGKAAPGKAKTGQNKSADMWLGQQLRALRKGRGLSLVDLAGGTGLSIGNISQIERGISSPSVRSLKKLGEALQIAVGDLFQEADLPPAGEMGYIVRRKTRPLLNLGATGVQKELLTPTTPGALQLLMVTIAPGGSSGPEH